MVHETTWISECPRQSRNLVLHSRAPLIPSKSGLTEACINSPHTHEFVKSSVMEYIKQWIPEPRVGVIAGNTVHMDRIFLSKYMPDITGTS